MDSIILSYLSILPVAILFLSSKSFLGRPWVRRLICLGYAVLIAFMVYMEIATFPFMDEFDLRPDIKFLEYLNHLDVVAKTVLKAYPLEFAFGMLALVLSLYVVTRSFQALQRRATPWSLRQRLIAFPLVLGLLIFGGRSTITPRPANLSSACFSENHLVNELALDSTYTVLYAAYRFYRHDRNPSLDYGKISEAEVFARVRKQLTFPTPETIGEIPFLHQQHSIGMLDGTPDGALHGQSKSPLNVVIFLQESMGAVDVGCLEGPDITPNVCKLKDQGLWFPNLYATGTRTVRGIEATVAGFLPTSAVGVLKLSRARTNFFTAGSLFKAHGYSTSFIYGGMSNFDEMRSFFLGNGFESMYDQPTFENPVFEGTWGVSDEDLVRKANEVYVAQGKKPFFSLILSTSNHLPYEYPAGRVELYEQPANTHLNAIKYADYAIGLFFDLARKEEYFKNTIFLVVADHNSHVRGNEHVPIAKFHIPAFVIGPNVPRKVIDTLASQIDLLPTLLHFAGIDTEHPMIGRDLMSLPPGTPGRAIMQYGSNNAYRVGNQVVINRPFLPPDGYTYDDKTRELTPAPLDENLARDALAFAHLPWLLYSKEVYHLPKN